MSVCCRCRAWITSWPTANFHFLMSSLLLSDLQTIRTGCNYILAISPIERALCGKKKGATVGQGMRGAGQNENEHSAAQHEYDCRYSSNPTPQHTLRDFACSPKVIESYLNTTHKTIHTTVLPWHRMDTSLTLQLSGRPITDSIAITSTHH